MRDGSEVHLSLPEETLTADVALIAVGRRPLTDGLGLEDAGVQTTSSGHVKTTRELAATAAGVFAAGGPHRGPTAGPPRLRPWPLPWPSTWPTWQVGTPSPATASPRLGHSAYHLLGSAAGLGGADP